MKKLRLFTLSILLVLCAGLFSACGDPEEIKAEEIQLNEAEVFLRLGEECTIDVSISPDDVTSKEFEIFGGESLVASAVADVENMKITITAKENITNGLRDTVFGVRTLDGSGKETHVAVNIRENEQNAEVPQNLRLEGSFLVWDNAFGAKSYTLQIGDKKIVVRDERYALDVSSLAGQNFIAKVKSNGKSKNLDSEWTEDFSFSVLSTPTNVKFNYDTYLLTWNAVSNAEGYTVQINDRIVLTDETQLDMTNQLLETGNIAIKVKAYGGDEVFKVDSLYSDPITFTKLLAPTDFGIANGRVSWKSVVGAVYYNVYYTYAVNGEQKEEVKKVSSTSFILPYNIDAGNYVVKVSAVGNNKATISSDYGFEINYTKLAKVENLRVEDGVVVWNQVPYATSYTVYFENIMNISGQPHSISVDSQTGDATMMSLDLTGYEAGEYRINVKANGPDNTISGNLLDSSISVVKLGAPTNLKLVKDGNDYLLEWKGNTYVGNYLITLMTDEETLKTYNVVSNQSTVSFKLPKNDIVVGYNLIYLKVLGEDRDGISYINSSETLITIEKLNSPLLETDSLKSDGILSWNNIAKSASYEVVVENMETLEISVYAGMTVTNINFNSNAYKLDVGTYKIIVRAIADINKNGIDGEYSDELIVQKIDYQNVCVEDGTIYDLEENTDFDYEYCVCVYDDSGKVISTRAEESINNYVSNIIKQGTTISVQVKVIPKEDYASNGDEVYTYFISSDLSGKIYAKKLPNITDLNMVDGVLTFGANYENLSNFEFIMTYDTDELNVGTDTARDFGDAPVGLHSVSVRAISTEQGSGSSSDILYPCNLNSYASTAYNFKKLGIPEYFKISSFANVASTVPAIIKEADNYNISKSGAVVWNRVEGATSYKLTFDTDDTIITTKTVESLQNTNIKAGEHTVYISAIGNGGNIISSNNSQVVQFKKFATPQNLNIQNNILSWEYENHNDDPNKDLNNPLGLMSSSLQLAIYVIIDERGYYYNTLEDRDLSDLSGAISAIKSNSCTLPESLIGRSKLKVMAVPFNAYVSNLMTLGASKIDDDKMCVVSDCSNIINIESLMTPLDLKVENNIISWSPLRYNTDSFAPLDAYKIMISVGEEDYELLIKQDSVRHYDFENKTLYVLDLTDTDECKIEFTQQRFNEYFGENAYVTGHYSIKIQAIANNISYSVGDKKIYYINSSKSAAVNVEVLSNPVLFVENGVVSWNEISNVEKYRLFVNKTAEGTDYIETTDTYFKLDEEYEAGLYYFNIISIGDGSKTLTSELDEENEKQFTKLDAITGQLIKNGLVAYSANDIVKEDNDCFYSLFIRKSTDKDDIEYENEKYTTFELDNRFADGTSYYIRVRANGDNNSYLNSNLTDYYYVDPEQTTLPTKLVAPASISIADGILKWSRSSGTNKYVLSISGGNLEQDCDETLENLYYDFENVPSGTYTVKVKAVGSSYYLNSGATTKTDVRKLEDVENLHILNGYISWAHTNGSNYYVVIDGEKVEITNDNSSIESGLVKYNLHGYQSDEYDVYVYNYGDSDAISSSPTATITYSKLGEPTGLTVDKETLIFEPVANARDYAITIEVNKLDETTSTYVYMLGKTEADASGDYEGYMTVKFTTLQEYTNVTNDDSYNISVRAIGDTEENELDTSMTYYVTSNDSDIIEITKPDTPEWVDSIETMSQFGKIEWQPVSNADYYKLYINASEEAHKVFWGYDIANKLQDDNHLGYYYYIVTGKTYANVIYTDNNYSFIVVACKNKDGYDSDNSAILSQVEYSIFGGDEYGTITNPYVVSTENQFNAIKYNVFAYYQLANDIKLENVPQSIGTEDLPFVGVFDGNNYKIEGAGNVPLAISGNTFVGLFDVIGNAGVVKNIVFNASITSTASKDSQIQVAGFAKKNYGTIENVIMSGSVACEYNFDSFTIYNAGICVYNYGLVKQAKCTASIAPTNSKNDVYAGGIAVYNYGTIEKSGFTGNAEGQVVGGISAYNYNGTITECYYQIENNDTFIHSQNKGLSSNYVGGLVGYMDGGMISYSYAYGEVFGYTTTSYVTYVGGLVGYAQAGNMNNSYEVAYDGENNLVQGKGQGTARVGAIAGQFVSLTCSRIIYVANGHRAFGVGTLSGVQLVTSINNDIKTAIINCDSYFNSGEEYPTLKNAKY